ncbi:hypothetical protein [Caulobacter sp. Root1455]|uniref:hypothetical protein n=1 Tax=Caulobacter sp. Root1455 TaxID=1736465 RepID=UPI0012E3B615|nr:hypothetical protein [Caulobacter sp. Root1455]
MIAALVSMFIAQAPLTQDTYLFCSTGFLDGVRTGYLTLRVDHDYRPEFMQLSLNDPDGWTRATVSLDPNNRKLPGVLSGMFFHIQFKQKPVFPLALKAYADGQLRWQKTINTPFMPALVNVDATPGSGTADYLSRADDGLPVATPREVTIVVNDSKGLEVGALRYPLLSNSTQAAGLEAIERLEAAYNARACSPPPPLID